jgi:hypothetical protein
VDRRRAHAGRASGSYAPPTAVVHQLYLALVKVEALRPASSGGADEKAAYTEYETLVSSDHGSAIRR